MTYEERRPRGTPPNANTDQARTPKSVVSIAEGAHDPAPLAVTVGETVADLLRRHELDQANDRQWLELGHKSGYAQGYADGYAAAEADMDRAWAVLAERIRSYSREPTFATLEERRGETARSAARNGGRS